MDISQVLTVTGQTLVMAAALYSGLSLIASAIDRLSLIQNAALRRARDAVDEIRENAVKTEPTVFLTPAERHAARVATPGRR